MKLIQKTNIYYLISTTLVLAFAYGLIFFTLKSFSSKQENLNLLLRARSVAQLIENDGEIPNLIPFIEVEEISEIPVHRYLLKKTYVLNPYEKEKELYNEFVSFKSIKNKNYKIIIRNAQLDSDDFVSDITRDVILVFVFLLFSLFLINLIISKKIWKSFYSNLLIIKNIKIGESKTVEFISSNIDEFSELNKTLEELFARAQIEYNTLKEFTENASHELQTPLAVIKSSIENLIQNIDFTEKQSEIIQNVENSIKRMTNLNNGLFLLAKLDNNQFDNNVKINASTLLNRLVNYYEELINAKNILLETKIEENIFVYGNEFLIDILLSNLISNSIKHNVEGGYISINLNSKYLKINNSGEQLNINPEEFFRRFKKASLSSASSTGLGLAIVNKIGNYFNWKINYNYKNKDHELTIWF